MAVNDIIGKEHRNLQAAVGNSGFLQRTVFRACNGVERAADSSGSNFLENLRLRHFPADTDQTQLADLFVQSHLFHQFADEGILGLKRCIVRGGSALGHH
ncbi:hypothetical protein AN901_202025 [Pseudomonas syringae pv. theae]|nr:hypothetical protein AN901_202025 [Pseudomonas syringae pv. theae]RMS55905.1 hypothetical protein ALP64_200590 [Pseudomonas syringae pv. actinidiae]